MKLFSLNVQMFISAGNSGPGMNTIGDPSVAGKVVSVGAYISDDTYLADYGAQLYEDDNLHYFSSRGPREDGGFKPNIVASGVAISSIPMWQPQGCLASVCPVGYALFNGTSMAAPQAAGGGALLVSAAKQAGVQHQPAQLRKAINSTARFLSGRYQAYEQGNGLFNVGAAWEVLKNNVKTVSISSSVPVNTILLIGCSVLDPSWIDKVITNGNCNFLLLAEGLFMFLSKQDVKDLLQLLAQKLICS